MRFDEDDKTLEEAKKVMRKILGGEGQYFSLGQGLGGIRLNLGGLLGGGAQRGAITSIPPKTSTGSQPARRHRTIKKPSAGWQAKGQMPWRKPEERKVDLKDLVEWAVEELAIIFELEMGGKADLEKKKKFILDFVPEALIDEIIEKARKLSEIKEDGDE